MVERQTLEHLADCFLQHRMSNFRSDFGQWLQNKATPMQSRMRHCQSRTAFYAVAEKKYVDVDDTWTLGDEPLPAHSVLDTQNCLEKLLGSHPGFEGNYAV